MNYFLFLAILSILLSTACNKDGPTSVVHSPNVYTDSTFVVLSDQNISYAEGLSHDGISSAPFSIPLLLDLYYPDNSATNRPVFMFIHGGGFKGGTKTKPEIVNMANYFASRGWVFASIDYRTSSDLGTIHTGIVPQKWLDSIQQNTTTSEELLQGLAMYTAQRDAKAALRWIVSNTGSYATNTDYITVGGASAGAITALTLGITNPEDFRDELTTAEDATLSTTNLHTDYDVKNIINFWGSNIKLELFESVYGHNRYDSNEPELMTAHGTLDPNPITTYSEAIELQDIYNSLSIYNEMIPLDSAGHGAWDATVNGNSLSDLSFGFLVNRQHLTVD